MALRTKMTNFSVFTRSFGVYGVPTVLHDGFKQHRPTDPEFTFATCAANLALEMLSTSQGEEALTTIAEVFDRRARGYTMFNKDGAEIVPFSFLTAIRKSFPGIVIDDSFDDPAKMAYTPRVRGGLPVQMEFSKTTPRAEGETWRMDSYAMQLDRAAERLVALQAQIRGQDTVPIADDDFRPRTRDDDACIPNEEVAKLVPKPVSDVDAREAARNPRRQWIWLNATRFNGMLHAAESGDQNLFRLFQFQLVHTFLRELAHLFVAWLGEDGCGTPAEACHRLYRVRPDDYMEGPGDAGRYLELEMFGGSLEWYQEMTWFEPENFEEKSPTLAESLPVQFSFWNLTAKKTPKAPQWLPMNDKGHPGIPHILLEDDTCKRISNSDIARTLSTKFSFPYHPVGENVSQEDRREATESNGWYERLPVHQLVTDMTTTLPNEPFGYPVEVEQFSEVLEDSTFRVTPS